MTAARDATGSASSRATASARRSCPRPSVVDAATAAVAGRPTVDWVPLPLGAAAIDEHGHRRPRQDPPTLAAGRLAAGPPRQRQLPRAAPLGLNFSGTIRKHFDLFANIRPAKSFQGARAVSSDTDLVIVRENTQGFYADRRHLRRHRRVHAVPGRGRRLGHRHPGRSSGSPRSPATWPSAAAGT